MALLDILHVFTRYPQATYYYAFLYLITKYIYITKLTTSSSSYIYINLQHFLVSLSIQSDRIEHQQQQQQQQFFVCLLFFLLLGFLRLITSSFKISQNFPRHAAAYY